MNISRPPFYPTACPRQVSIISISRPPFCLTAEGKPASEASAARPCASPPLASRHHEHEPHACLPDRPRQASIISISRPPFCLTAEGKPASEASAARPCASPPLTSRHHEHEPHACLPDRPQKASIISISRPPFCLTAPNKPASSASAARPCA